MQKHPFDLPPHEYNEIMHAIIENRFEPLRLVNGKFVRVAHYLSERAKILPPGIKPEMAQAAYEAARRNPRTAEERRAFRDYLKAKYREQPHAPVEAE